MPPVGLPDDLLTQLNNSVTKTISNTDGPGVAVYWASDNSSRADIYIGLDLDGDKRYENISSINPNITMQFSIPPDLFCQSDDIHFDPSKNTILSIKVLDRLRPLGHLAACFVMEKQIVYMMINLE